MNGLLRRLLVRVSAGLLLLAAVAGLPTGLVAFIGWPLPSAWPTHDEAAGWVTTPVTDTMILNTLAVAAWLLWAAFLHATLAEARAAWRGMPTRATTSSTANPLRLAAATLITALTVGTVLSGAAAAANPAQARPAIDKIVTSPPLIVVQQGPAIVHVGAASYSYVVKRHDTLSKIAREWLGDPDRWPEICKLNWHRHWPTVGGTLRDCNLIYPGWDLRLPADAKPPHGADPAPPPPRTPPDSQPDLTKPPPAPTPSTEPPQDPDGVIETTTPPSASPALGAPPTDTATPPATSQPATTPSPESADTSQDRPDNKATAGTSTDHDGVQLPGGSFIPWALAAAITAAAAMVWLQRRRRFIPNNDHHDDPPELPPPVAELQRQVTRNPALPMPHDLAERAAAVPEMPPLPAGGVGLIGDGAHAAARAALISTLASGGPRNPDRRGEVVIDGTTLTTLIGADAAALGTWPRLHVADNLDHALAILDTRLLHRARILDEHSLTDLDTLRDRAPDEEALPPVLLIAETPPAGARMRARISFGLGAGLDISALLLGAWPHGSTIDVATDGHTRLVNGPPVQAIGERIAMLDTTEAVQILDTLREAHTGEPPTHRPTPSTPHAHGSMTDTDTGDVGGRQPEQAAGGQPAKPGGQPTKVRLRVLGTPGVEDITLPGRPLRGKAAELAVYLACHPDGADTATIADHLLPDARQRAASQQVHTNASNLRHVLGRAGGPLPGGYLVKRGTTARYRLDPATVNVDLWQLRHLLSRAQIASTPARTQMLREACDLYTAPLAAGCDYEWIEPHRENANKLGIEAHLLLAADLLATDPQTASDLLDKAIGLDRYNEQLYVKAMHARHALHDPDGIHTLLRAATKALADLEITPAHTTVELAGQLRASLDNR